MDEWQRISDQPYRPTCENAPIPPTVIAAIQSQAATEAQLGEIVTATATLDQLNDWLQANGQFKNFGEDSHRFIAKTWAEQGRVLAQEGRLDEALTKFLKAVALDLTVLTVETEQIMASALVHQGRMLAQKGKLDEALSHFEQAVELNETLDLAILTTEANIAVAAAHIAATAVLPPTTAVTTTIALWQEALRLVETVESPVLAGRLCHLATQAPPAAQIAVACDYLSDWAETITHGLSVTGVITSPVGHLWRLEIATASHITIALSAFNSELNTYVSLYDPQFNLLAENDNLGFFTQDAFMDGLLLTKPGAYWIEASRCCPGDDRGTVGAYHLVVTIHPQVAPTPTAQFTPTPVAPSPLVTPKPSPVVRSPLATPTPRATAGP